MPGSLGLRSRKWAAAADNAPQADATIDHPAPQGAFIDVDHVPLWIAPDPGGVAPRAGSLEALVEPLQTPIQHSPLSNWSPGTPYPGPPARVTVYVDSDSRRWWGSTGLGVLVWSGNTEFSSDLPPPIPWDLPQHVDNFQGFWGGYPSIARSRPPAFGDQVPQLDPSASARASFGLVLPPG